LSPEGKGPLRVTKEEQLRVVGMHCATCVTTVTKALTGVKGVVDANVNLASGTAKVVVGDSVRLRDLVEAVRRAGYDVVTERVRLRVSMNPEDSRRVSGLLEGLKGVVRASVNPGTGEAVVEINPYSTSAEAIAEALTAHGFRAQVVSRAAPPSSGELRGYIRSLMVAWSFGLLTLYLQYTSRPLLAMLASAPVVFYAGLRYHTGAYRALRNRTTNMDTLVSTATLVAWLYSAYSLLTRGPVFFDAASLLISFLLIGKTIEAYIRERLSGEVASLLPARARVIRGGEEVEVNADEVKVGDLLLVRSGEVIAADGVVEEGKGEVDESILTGESMPSLKTKGSPVVGGSRLVSGFLRVYVTRSGDRTYVAQLMTAVRDAEAARLKVQDLVDRVAAAFTPTIVAVAAATFLAWHFALGAPTPRAVLFAVAVLASACPCALGLATPMAVLVSVHRLAKRGVVVKDGEALERLKDVDVFVIDKTGTLTEGRPRVKDFVEAEPGAMELASSLEALSSHPVARAIVERFGARLRGSVKEFNEFPGDGVAGVVGDRQVIVGRPEFIAQNCQGEVRGDVAVCVDGRVAGWLTLEDPVRPEAEELVSYLKSVGKRVVIATGDSGPSADAVALRLGVEVRKGLSPDDKAELVRRLKEEGHRVAFIGDGVNDAVAEREADVGIALAGGTDIAKYAGDFVVTSLRGVRDLLRESRVVVRKVRENLAWAFGYNSVLVPLSAGMLYPAVYISPPYAALAMSMSSVIVSLWSMVPA
jgi:Cu2+-exporting ATPase